MILHRYKNTIKRCEINICGLKIKQRHHYFLFFLIPVSWHMRMRINQSWIISSLTHKCTRTMFIYLLSGKQTGKSKWRIVPALTQWECAMCVQAAEWVWHWVMIWQPLAEKMVLSFQPCSRSEWAEFICVKHSLAVVHTLSLSPSVCLFFLASLKQRTAKPSVVTEFQQSFHLMRKL